MDCVNHLKAALDSASLVLPPDISSRYLCDWHVRADAATRPLALTLPRTTQDVSRILEICNRAGTPVVPQGGLTGLTGGAVPLDKCIIISLERMRSIEEIDGVGGTMTVQAGAPLQAVQEAAAQADLLFPLDIGARGSCQIGGNVATNAGGNHVLKYGMMRDLILGMEAVLADGTILNSMNKMLKNNAGYDLKQLFIGSEGTLGVVTRVVLRLFPRPKDTHTALCAFGDFDDVYEFLRSARAHLATSLSAFEVMWPQFYTRAVGASRLPPPVRTDHAAYVLIEATGTMPAHDAEHFSSLIESAIDRGTIADAVVSQSIADTNRLWAIRDMSGELVQQLAPVGNFDVSIDVRKSRDFIADCTDRLRQRWSDAEVICFGHLADGNIHIFVTIGDRPFPSEQIDKLVYDCVERWDGSISAEHGIGTVKRGYLKHSRTPEEVAVMKALKKALDPQGILNPGKVI